MLNKLIKDIKIEVTTKYEGTNYRNYRYYFVHSYFITIKNLSDNTIQLNSRFWLIFDALNKKEIVEGKGVVGETPIIEPQQSYSYQSGCYLQSTFGYMKGYYIFTNKDTGERFKVNIPIFQLNVPTLSN